MWTFALLDTSLLLLMIFGIVFLAAISSLAANEKGVSSTLTVVGLLVALQIFTVDVKPFTYAGSHPLEAAGVVIGYLALGVVYLYARWRWFFIRDVKAAHDVFISHNTGLNGYSSMDAAFASSSRANDLGVKRFPIKVSDYKGMLYCWNFYWPLLIVHSVVKDPLRIFREQISKTLQNVADSAFEK